MSWQGTFSQHLSPAQLACLVDGFDGPAEAFKSLLHLRTCRRCRAHLINEFPTDGPELVHDFNLDRDPHPLSFPAPRSAPRGVAISEFAESWAIAAEAIADELLAAPTLAKDLEQVSPARQYLALEARRFQTLGFAIHLLAKSCTLWNDRPTESRRLTKIALAVVSKLDPSDYPLGLRADVHCKALAYLGNALRLTGKLREADKSLTEALNRLERGTGASVLRGRVLALLAHLHRDQRRFPQALAEACEAKEIYQGLGDSRQVAMLALVHASILAEIGATAWAIQELKVLLSSVPRSVMGETIFWTARQNLSQTLVEGDRLWEARRELRDVKRWSRRAGKPLITARVLWVEALLTAREGDSTSAALRLERVRDVFLSHDLPYDAALACLDLAALYLRRGRLEEAQEIAGVLAPIFRASGIRREALASLRLLTSALEKKAATTAQVEGIHRHLTRQRRRDSHN